MENIQIKYMTLYRKFQTEVVAPGVQQHTAPRTLRIDQPLSLVAKQLFYTQVQALHNQGFPKINYSVHKRSFSLEVMIVRKLISLLMHIGNFEKKLYCGTGIVQGGEDLTKNH